MLEVRVLLLALLVGCAKDGVIVEVETTGLDVASVELVLSDRGCQDPQTGDTCGAVQGQGFTSFVGEPGDLYARDASATVRELADGVARFELPADRRRLRMAFAIGRDAQDQIVGAAVMADTLDLAAGPVVYRATLDPTSDLRAGRQPGAAAAAQWGAPARCLGVLPLRSTMQVQRPIFIVPDDDPDCDGRRTTADGECDPLWFDGMTFDEATAEHCARPSMMIAGQPCVIGHIPQCVEPDLPEPPCLESPIRCVPDLVCQACATGDTACQNDKLGSAAADARLDCTFPASANNGLGVSQTCDGNNDSFLIVPTQLPSGSARCLDAQLAMRSTPIDSPLEKQFTTNGATFTVADVLEDCTIKLKWEGTFPLNGRAVTTLVLTVDVDGQERQLWLPITFTANASCDPGNVVGCEYIDSGEPDKIAACTQ